MKTTLTGTPCWVLSSHGHPCAAPGSGPHFAPDAPVPGSGQRVAARRRRPRPTNAVAYWLEADASAGRRSRLA